MQLKDRSFRAAARFDNKSGVVLFRIRRVPGHQSEVIAGGMEILAEPGTVTIVVLICPA